MNKRAEFSFFKLVKDFKEDILAGTTCSSSKAILEVSHGVSQFAMNPGNLFFPLSLLLFEF